MKTLPHTPAGAANATNAQRQERRHPSSSGVGAQPAHGSSLDPRAVLMAARGKSRAQTNGALALLERPLTLPTPRPSAARQRILVVEDDARMAGVIRASLELEGEADWAVQMASMGMLALELADAAPPDVVLLDVRLPDLDGAEVYRRLRADERTRGARILFLSAGTSLDLYQRGIEDGVLLRKPFDVGELAALVRALLVG